MQWSPLTAYVPYIRPVDILQERNYFIPLKKMLQISTCKYDMSKEQYK